MWTVMFNAMCPASLAAEKVTAEFRGVMCSGQQVSCMLFLMVLVLFHAFRMGFRGFRRLSTWISTCQLRWSNCPKYHHMCTHGGPMCSWPAIEP